MKRNKLMGWEAALLLALCLFFLTGAWAEDAQADLAGHLVRLHVVANSDSAADQAEKLQVRDRVLALLAPLLADCATREQAEAVISGCRAQLEALENVSSVRLDTEYYPTRDYSTFSLPAGEYLSLRVVLGSGEGRNWWCVVFPPLCTEALAQPVTDAFSLLPEDEAGLVTQEEPVYILRFRLLEWWDQLCHALG